jgi:hypothetical protein
MISNQATDAVWNLDLGPIKTKLMHVESGEGWSQRRADMVEVEYKRFLHLMKIYPNEQLAPSFDIDTFWHYHILDTMKYAVDCETVFGYFLHHYPYVGLRGEDDAEVHERSGDRMRELYELTFAAAYFAGGSDESGSADLLSAYCAAPGSAAAQAYCAAPAKPSYCAAPAKPASQGLSLLRSSGKAGLLRRSGTAGQHREQRRVLRCPSQASLLRRPCQGYRRLREQPGLLRRSGQAGLLRRASQAVRHRSAWRGVLRRPCQASHCRCCVLRCSGQAGLLRSAGAACVPRDSH